MNLSLELRLWVAMVSFEKFVSCIYVYMLLWRIISFIDIVDINTWSRFVQWKIYCDMVMKSRRSKPYAIAQLLNEGKQQQRQTNRKKRQKTTFTQRSKIEKRKREHFICGKVHRTMNRAQVIIDLIPRCARPSNKPFDWTRTILENAGEKLLLQNPQQHWKRSEKNRHPLHHYHFHYHHQ